LKATKASLGAWVHTLLFEYLRTLLSWTLKPKWRAKTAHKQAMLQALVDAWRGKWGRQQLFSKSEA
jgi:hypothetical protein